jgi:hypothetical protein
MAVRWRKAGRSDLLGGAIVIGAAAANVWLDSEERHAQVLRIAAERNARNTLRPVR